MPSPDSSALLVARFLKASGYTQSFDAFIVEAGLQQSAGDTNAGDLTIERLLDEKRVFDKAINFEKLNLSDDTEDGWREPAPLVSTKVDVIPNSVNVLNIAASGLDQADHQVMLASSSDRQARIISIPELKLVDEPSIIRDAPTLSQLVLSGRDHVATLMSGELIVSDLMTGDILHKRKDHKKFAVSVIAYQESSSSLLATAGWDNKVFLYRYNRSSDSTGRSTLSAPIATIELPTRPEAIIFVEHPVTARPILIITRTDSSHLHFYSVDEQSRLLGKQNLAPYSNTWVAFTPSSIALSPRDPGVIAVATSSTPHMKLLVVRLLLPHDEGVLFREEQASQTQLEQARAEQVTADREHNAIELQCNTMSPQTLYSTPLVVWRPHGRGVWVNSDDGVIRGIDTLSGKIVHRLQAHDEGSKIRTLWAGYANQKPGGSAGDEWLISGGFDHKLFVWRSSSA